MLTKKDLKQIGELINLKLADFFEQVIAPYLDKHVEKKFDEMDERFDQVDRKLDKMTGRLDRHDSTFNNHKKRIFRLEKHPAFA